MRLELFQPDMAPNAGTLMRLAACLGVAVDLIEPAGFVIGGAKFRRAALDYLDRLTLCRHLGWAEFVATCRGRIVLLTTGGTTLYHRAEYRVEDTLLVGRETGGVPAEVHDAAGLRVRIPMLPGARSINVATAAAMVLGEAMRQTELLPA